VFRNAFLSSGHLKPTILISQMERHFAVAVTKRKGNGMDLNPFLIRRGASRDFLLPF